MHTHTRMYRMHLLGSYPHPCQRSDGVIVHIMCGSVRSYPFWLVSEIPCGPPISSGARALEASLHTEGSKTPFFLLLLPCGDYSAAGIGTAA